MKISVGVGGYARGDIKGAVEFVMAADRLGVDSVWSAEAWGQDAVTTLAYLAAKTERIKLGTGIMQISARTPSMTAMTALSLNELSEGRFLLGLGASGPQVVEGLHGVPYRQPLTRLKETVAIIRQAFRGEKLAFEGKHHHLPLPGGEGKALRLDHPPAPIPIYLATLGPKALAFTGAEADGWLGTSFSPDHAEAHLQYLRQGAEAAERPLSALALHAAVAVGIGDNVEAMINARRPGVAFQMGAMGSANTNFYNEAFQRAGFVAEAQEIQRLWIAGDRAAAAARVPDAMITEFQAVGTREMVRERFMKYRDVGITCLGVRVEGEDYRGRIDALEEVMDLIKDL